MSLRNVVDNECGGVNPMVGLSKHFVKDNAFAERKHFGSSSVANASSYGHIGSNVQQMVNEFVADKQASNVASDMQPFRMDSLLREVQRLDDPVIDDSFGTFSKSAKQWSKEFCAEDELNAYKMGYHTEGNREVTDDIANAKWADEYLAHTERQLLPTQTDASVVSSQWTQDFLSTDPKSIAEEANKLMETIDPALNETDFVRFIKKIGNSEMTADNEGFAVDSETTAENWSKEYSQTSEQWSKEFGNQKSRNEEEDYGYDDDTEFWAKLAKDWKEMGLVDEATDADKQWLNEFANDIRTKDEYKFNEENPLKEHPNPFEEGLKKLEEGDIPSAVLLFEAAVQKEPTAAKAWELLGTTQAENEHDSAAIAALNKCLSLEPNNLKALMALGVSYTNESMQSQACNALKEWIRRNPKYQQLLPQTETSDEQHKSESFTFGPPFAISSIITSGQHQEVRDLFIAAARLSPNEADPDVQCGLGVLFNLSGEYDKAADCFQSALHVRPNDSHLWNRLGATLANGNQSEAAINAYREALALSPGFIRSRFNLGISCINLGAYKEAAEHFLTVLNFQAAGRGPTGSRPLMSSNVWSTLRMVLTLMNRSDLIELADNRDLVRLSNEFLMNDPNS